MDEETSRSSIGFENEPIIGSSDCRKIDGRMTLGGGAVSWWSRRSPGLWRFVSTNEISLEKESCDSGKCTRAEKKGVERANLSLRRDRFDAKEGKRDERAREKSKG